MTLFRQFIVAITLLIMFLMAGNLIVSVINARGYVFEQMQVHAQDTATSLGLTISHAAKAKDEAQVASFIDVVFDRGYYRQIYYRSLDGELEIERLLPMQIEGVPEWFVSLLDLPEPSGQAEVVSGWYRLGELQVVSHPGYAYQDLWRVFREQLWLLLLSAAVCYPLAWLGLHYLLRPLKKVEEQAQAICRREFSVQQDLPRTPELRRVVEAMNRMVEKVGVIFQEQVELTETLHRQAHLDPVTGLSNRRDFDARFEAFIKSERGGSAGILLLLQVTQLQVFNEKHGREAGDSLLVDIATVLKEQTAHVNGAILSRRAGADFCAFIPTHDPQEGRDLVAGLYAHLQALRWLGDASELDLHMGSTFSDCITLSNQLLTEADLALRQAQHQGGSGYAWYQPDNGEPIVVRSASDWRQKLDSALAKRSLEFFYQPAYGRDKGMPIHYEVLCRLREGDELLNAGVFWPMVERLGLSSNMDQLVLEMLYEQTQWADWEEAVFSVNLSPGSIQDPTFVTWLDAFLGVDPAFAKRMLFELPEQALVSCQDEVRKVAMCLRKRGARLCIDHFGEAASAFQYLQSLPVDQLKVARRFVSGVDTNADNQFFIKSLLQIARSCEVALLVEGVESEAEWQRLLALGVDGGQGFYLGKPSPILA